MNSWFRMYSEFANDPKVQMLSESMQRRLVMLFCRQESEKLMTWGDEDSLIAFWMRISEEEARETKDELILMGWIDETWSVIDRRYVAELVRPFQKEWSALRATVFARDDYTCVYCGERGARLECDHVHPVAKGGGHDLSNLATACFRCNRSKRDKLLSVWRGH